MERQLDAHREKKAMHIKDRIDRSENCEITQKARTFAGQAKNVGPLKRATPCPPADSEGGPNGNNPCSFDDSGWHGRSIHECPPTLAERINTSH